MKTVLTLVSVLAFASPLFAATSTWNIDPTHTEARFKIRHMMVSNVNGAISGAKGTFTVDESDITKMKAEATLDTNTINTSNAKRDEHLKSPDFFDAKKFPTIAFKAKKIVKTDGDKFDIVADLTIHGVTKEVTLKTEGLTPAIKDPFGNTRRGLSGTATITRKDFGLVWNKTMDGGGLVLGETADVSFEIELTAADKAGKKS